MDELNQVEGVYCVIDKVEHDACHVGSVYVVGVVIHRKDQGDQYRPCLL